MKSLNDIAMFFGRLPAACAEAMATAAAPARDTCLLGAYQGSYDMLHVMFAFRDVQTTALSAQQALLLTHASADWPQHHHPCHQEVPIRHVAVCCAVTRKVSYYQDNAVEIQLRHPHALG
jgi:hypothetical protein